MKRSDMILIISNNLQKHDNIFRGYSYGTIDLKCACDNLATYILKEIEEKGMSSPSRLPSEKELSSRQDWEKKYMDYDFLVKHGYNERSWEPEN